MTVYSNCESDTEKWGETLGKTLAPGAVAALFGDLGAGKTTFVRGLARGLGITSRVTSPTFTIVNEYAGDVPLFHFDMYRISGSEELYEIGWDDYSGRGGVTVVEWSENIADALPEDSITVKIEKLGADSRKIEITGGNI